MPSPISTVDDLFRGDLVEVDQRHFKPGTTAKQRRFYISFTTTQGSSHTELCNNPYRKGLMWRMPTCNIRLLRRGNWFRYQFNMPLEFTSISDEAMFWENRGRMHELRNPADDLFYTWTTDQARAALLDGSAHAFFYSSGLLGLPDDVFFGGYTFDDPEVAERMRQHSLTELTQLPVG